MRTITKIFFFVVFHTSLFAFHTLDLNAQLVSDFRVNDDTTNTEQYSAKIGVDSSGSFTAVWNDKRNGRSNVFCQRLSPYGIFLGTNFRININPDSSLLPAIAVAPNGNFAVCWLDVNNNLTIITKVKCRIFNNEGVPLSNEILINDTLGYIIIGPSISVNNINEFVITWAQKNILYQRLDPLGNKLGSNQKVNDDILDIEHRYPAVSTRLDGNFIITWNDTRPPSQPNCDDVYMQMFDKLGNKIGTNQRVNDDTASINLQFAPKVSTDSSGNFVITWNDDRLDISHGEIYAQMYGNIGNKIGINFRVTFSSLQYSKGLSAIDTKTNGDFVISWTESRNFIGAPYIQRYKVNGTAYGNNYLVTTQATSTEKFSSDCKIYKDKIINVWSDERNGPFDVYCNIRSYTNPDTSVNIIQTSTMLPERFSLNQNYPNPFNNSTKIQFDILESNNYKLTVFNNLGQKVKEILNQNLNSGSYSVNFQAENLGSGVYQYILSSPKERLVKSFVLLK